MKPSLRLLSGAAFCIAYASCAPAAATCNPDLPQVMMGPHFANDYSLLDLCDVPGVPENYGGLTFRLDDNNTLLLGGLAWTPGAKIYSVPLKRDATGHISGFAGTATVFANANGSMGGIDSGLAYGPDGV